MQDNKFNINDSYKCSMLTGGTTRYTVVDRTDKQVTMKEEWMSEDTLDNQKDFTKFDIEIENGIEKICVWEYHGHSAWIYANESLF